MIIFSTQILLQQMVFCCHIWYQSISTGNYTNKIKPTYFYINSFTIASKPIWSMNFQMFTVSLPCIYRGLSSIHLKISLLHFLTFYTSKEKSLFSNLHLYSTHIAKGDRNFSIIAKKVYLYNNAFWMHNIFPCSTQWTKVNIIFCKV